MIPSSLYDVDYTDTNGLKWSKTLSVMYPSLGNIDESIGYSRYDNDIVKYVYRKVTQYTPLYDDSVTFAADYTSPYVWKYFRRSGYPTSSVNINTIIIDSISDGQSYVIGVDDEAVAPYGNMGGNRVLVDAKFNNILIKSPSIRRFKDFTAGTNIIQAYPWEFQNHWEDTDLEHLNDNDFCGIYYSHGAKVWNGSNWADASLMPALLCSGDTVQSVQGAGSAFNNSYPGGYMTPLGSGQNMTIGFNTSNMFWSGVNFQNKMQSTNYCLGLSEDIEFKPDFAEDPDSKKADIKDFLLNNVAANTPVWISLERKVIEQETNGHLLILLEVYGQFSYNNNQDVYCHSMNFYATPCIRGKNFSAFIAGFGLYYLSDAAADLTGITPDNLGDSSKIWLGEMGADGTTTGNWIKGSDIATYTGYNKDGNVVNPDYDPSGGGGGSIEDKVDDMTLNPLFALSSDAGFASYWLVTASQLASFHNWLTTTTFPAGYDPYSYIISLIQFPLKLTNTWCLPGTSGNIHVGGKDTGITSNLIGNEKGYVGLGTFKVPLLQGNFLDYDPYSQYEIYIPCCGWVTVPDIVAGHTIACRINYDLTTAAIIGNVYVNINGDWLLIASKSGMMGRETVVSGEAQGVRSAQIQTALFSAGTGAINVAAGLMSGNAVAAVSGTYSTAAGIAQANVANNSSYVRQIGSTGGRALLCQFDQCYCKITTSEADVPDNYGHTVGYICNRSGKVSSFSGFTIFENFDTSGIAGATESERAEIKRIMESGVIIK